MAEGLKVSHASFLLAEAVSVHLLAMLKIASPDQPRKEKVVLITFLWNELPDIDEVDNQSKIQCNILSESDFGLPHDGYVHVEALPGWAFFPGPDGEWHLANKTLIQPF